MTPLASSLERLAGVEPARIRGRVRRIVGLMAECDGLIAPIGARGDIVAGDGRVVPVEVVSFRDETAVVMPLGAWDGVKCGDAVVLSNAPSTIPVGDALLGRILSSLGEPLDGLPPPAAEGWEPIQRAAMAPMERGRVVEPLETGIRAIDGLLTLGRGQRIGLFSGAGVGKSVLLGMLARSTAADVIVIALVGERGREVRDFVERELGPAGLRRSVLVVEAADRPALRRIKAPFAAMTIAEEFRRRGRHVLFLMDSLTRMALAQREIGLAAGEPPAIQGHPPSVFGLMPALLERAGAAATGSITLITTVLVGGDDPQDPIGDAARGVLDGHLWLSRPLAQQGHYPAIDPLASVSRLMGDVVGAGHAEAARAIRAVLSVHREAEDLVRSGVYVKGSDPAVEAAAARMPAVLGFLRQGRAERTGAAELARILAALASDQAHS